jgi:hypothetical protein
MVYILFSKKIGNPSPWALGLGQKPKLASKANIEGGQLRKLTAEAKRLGGNKWFRHLIWIGGVDWIEGGQWTWKWFALKGLTKNLDTSSNDTQQSQARLPLVLWCIAYTFHNYDWSKIKGRVAVYVSISKG